MSFRNPEPARLAELLRSVRTVAIVGLSPNAERPSHRVAAGMQKLLGWRIVPVRPLVDTVLGEKAFARLADIPFPVDMVDVFRNADEVGSIVDEVIALGIKHLWLQDGVINETEALRAEAAGVEVVMNRCVWRDALQLLD